MDSYGFHNQRSFFPGDRFGLYIDPPSIDITAVLTTPSQYHAFKQERQQLVRGRQQEVVQERIQSATSYLLEQHRDKFFNTRAYKHYQTDARIVVPAVLREIGQTPDGRPRAPTKLGKKDQEFHNFIQQVFQGLHPKNLEGQELYQRLITGLSSADGADTDNDGDVEGKPGEGDFKGLRSVSIGTADGPKNVPIETLIRGVVPYLHLLESKFREWKKEERGIATEAQREIEECRRQLLEKYGKKLLSEEERAQRPLEGKDGQIDLIIRRQAGESGAPSNWKDWLTFEKITTVLFSIPLAAMVLRPLINAVTTRLPFVKRPVWRTAEQKATAAADRKIAERVGPLAAQNQVLAEEVIALRRNADLVEARLADRGLADPARVALEAELAQTREQLRLAKETIARGSAPVSEPAAPVPAPESVAPEAASRPVVAEPTAPATPDAPTVVDDGAAPVADDASFAKALERAVADADAPHLPDGDGSIDINFDETLADASPAAAEMPAPDATSVADAAPAPAPDAPAVDVPVVPDAPTPPPPATAAETPWYRGGPGAHRWTFDRSFGQAAREFWTDGMGGWRGAIRWAPLPIASLGGHYVTEKLDLSPSTRETVHNWLTYGFDLPTQVAAFLYFAHKLAPAPGAAGLLRGAGSAAVQMLPAFVAAAGIGGILWNVFDTYGGGLNTPEKKYGTAAVSLVGGGLLMLVSAPLAIAVGTGGVVGTGIDKVAHTGEFYEGLYVAAEGTPSGEYRGGRLIRDEDGDVVFKDRRQKKDSKGNLVVDETGNVAYEYDSDTSGLLDFFAGPGFLPGSQQDFGKYNETVREDVLIGGFSKEASKGGSGYQHVLEKVIPSLKEKPTASVENYWTATKNKPLEYFDRDTNKRIKLWREYDGASSSSHNYKYVIEVTDEHGEKRELVFKNSNEAPGKVAAALRVLTTYHSIKRQIASMEKEAEEARKNGWKDKFVERETRTENLKQLRGDVEAILKGEPVANSILAPLYDADGEGALTVIYGHVGQDAGTTTTTPPATTTSTTSSGSGGTAPRVRTPRSREPVEDVK